ncbi:MAG: hypothetical protein IKV44_05360 [Clostridia bacterium]|nr:hypothetical protein [Clostridia bacterium]
MNKKEKEFNNAKIEISAESFSRNPETVEEMLNAYGTYNIQPTAVNENDFPAIAQGENKRMKERTHEFFRGESDENPASDTTKKQAF